MKSLIAAAALTSALIGTAHAGPAIPMDAGLTPQGPVALTTVAWVGRYGQICRHGPVWIPACHATNRPVGYMRGHWNATGTRFIPGRYY